MPQDISSRREASAELCIHIGLLFGLRRSLIACDAVAAARNVILLTCIVILLSACTAPASDGLTGPVSVEATDWPSASRQREFTRVAYYTARTFRISQVIERNWMEISYLVAPRSESAAEASVSITSGDAQRFNGIVQLLRSDGRVDVSISPRLGGAEVDPVKLLSSFFLGSHVFRAGQPEVQEIYLQLPSPVKIGLQCYPRATQRVAQWATLALSCSGRQHVSTVEFHGELEVSGSEDIDVKTGMLVAARLSGYLRGFRMSPGSARSRYDNYSIRYFLETETG